MSFFGIVDTFSSGLFTGWIYNNQLTKQILSVKINELKIREIEANLSRPDVQAAGLAPEQCGFSFQLHLNDLPKSQCTLSLTDLASGILLENGVFTLLDGVLTPGVASKTDDKVLSSLSIRQYLKAQEDEPGDQNIALVAKEILKSIEHLPDNTFIALSYLLVLGRIPDPEGFLNSLRNGQFEGSARYQFVSDMMRSEEFKRKRTPNLVLADLHGTDFSIFEQNRS